eukprot:TRINITY_DN10847_c0_g1_i1.p1 TRINITY_DN10847_c0_g1~~TRINITY_DN10847_c0_g1_i1.p1  ORF type:complete len:389 (-),score=25.49 TRINITY_DN10847_c0_g1_i1:106-1272(-)
MLVNLIKNSKTIVVYTGAGISTSAGISDYRSWDGVWTARLLGTNPKKSLTIDELRPTSAHMALSKLCSLGIVKHIVSTNVDNLHRRSGIPRSNLSELHGNCFKEVCSKCGREYFRSKSVNSYSNHITGNICTEPSCKGKLKDSIIHFGENLPENEIKPASLWSKKADIALVLGSSLRVKPACWLTEYCYSFGNDGKIVICNLQKTEYEDKSYLTLYAETDVVMSKIMSKLDLSIPPYDPSQDPTETEQVTDPPMNYLNEDNDTKFGVAVSVSTSCSHIELNYSPLVIEKLKQLSIVDGCCSSCHYPNENWFCAKCGTTHCGRHIKGHGLEHYKSSDHCIMMSFEDLSIWCYKCDDYIDNEMLYPVLFELHMKKFGVPHPKAKSEKVKK